MTTSLRSEVQKLWADAMTNGLEPKRLLVAPQLYLELMSELALGPRYFGMDVEVDASVKRFQVRAAAIKGFITPI